MDATELDGSCGADSQLATMSGNGAFVGPLNQLIQSERGIQHPNRRRANGRSTTITFQFDPSWVAYLLKRPYRLDTGMSVVPVTM